MPAEQSGVDSELSQLRLIVAIGGALYLLWWFAVEFLLPGSFNPLPGRLLVVGLDFVLLGASYLSRWVARHLSTLLLLWICLLIGHYFYLVIGNGGESTWWVGAFVTVAAASMCLLSRRDLAAFSLFTMGCAIGTAIVAQQAGRSIYVPGLATILLLANVAKRSEIVAQDAKLQAERARQERDRALEASRFKSMFLSLVSHELLTPLQSIRLSSDALTRATRTDASERLDHVERIARSGRRLTDLIESLLRHAQIENDKLSVLAEPFDLVALVTDAIDELSSQRHEKQLEVRVEAETSDCIVTSDPRLVRLVLVNLVGNAIKYTERGWVVVTVGSDASTYRISVRDTGRGIPPEHHERIFEAFTQLEPLEHKHVPGLGLGLALVKEMTAALGGRLELASVLGSGSTFALVLPRHPQAAQPASTMSG